ncbi:MAG: hypothetical protein ACYDBB_02155 [Armatimonadota bacterium]
MQKLDSCYSVFSRYHRVLFTGIVVFFLLCITTMCSANVSGGYMYSSSACLVHLRLTQVKTTVNGFAQVVSADLQTHQGYTAKTLHVTGEVEGTSISLHGNTMDQLFGSSINQCGGVIVKGALKLSFPGLDGKAVTLTFSPVSDTAWNSSVNTFEQRQKHAVLVLKWGKALQRREEELRSDLEDTAKTDRSDSNELPELQTAVEKAKQAKQTAEVKAAESSKSLKATQKELFTLQQKKQDTVKNKTLAESALRAKEREVSDCTTALSSAETNAGRMETNVSNAETALQNAKDALKLIEQSESKTADNIKTAKSAITDATDKLAKAKDALQSAQAKFDESKKELQKAEEERKQAKKLLETRADELNKAETAVSNCEDRVSTEEDTAKNAAEELQTASDTLTKAQKDVETTVGEIKEVRQRNASDMVELNLLDLMLLTPPLTELTHGTEYMGVATVVFALKAQPTPEANTLIWVKPKDSLWVLPIKAAWYPVLTVDGNIGWVQAKNVRVSSRVVR